MVALNAFAVDYIKELTIDVDRALQGEVIVFTNMYFTAETRTVLLNAENLPRDREIPLCAFFGTAAYLKSVVKLPPLSDATKQKIPDTWGFVIKEEQVATRPWTKDKGMRDGKQAYSNFVGGSLFIYY